MLIEVLTTSMLIGILLQTISVVWALLIMVSIAPINVPGITIGLIGFILVVSSGLVLEGKKESKR